MQLRLTHLSILPLCLGFLLSTACKVNASCADLGDPGCSSLLSLFWLKILKPRYYYATDQSGFVLQYSVNLETGALTQIAPKLAVPSPSWMTTEINGKFIYTQNSTTVSQLRVTPGTGALVNLGDLTIAATTLNGITYDALQRFVFVSSSGGSGAVVTLRVSSSGLLTPIQSFNPSTICNNNQGAAAHPGGKFLYCGNNTTIASRIIDGNTGALADGPNTLGVTGNIQTIGFDSGGNYLFVVTSTNVESYAVNQSTGALTLRSSLPFAAGSYSLTVFGNYVYASSNGLRTLSFDPNTGVLTSLATNASGGANAFGISIEAQGKFGYALNPGGGVLFTYARNSDGTMTTMNPQSGVTLGGVIITGSMSSPINEIFATDPM
ncbi:MAG: lactonase family protein [Spirochaetia bacterium]|nr:lactonase family protein [Spirochaetia bacterium]